MKATLHIVGHGYQLDIETREGRTASECRDFAGTYEVETIESEAIAAIGEAMRNLERERLSPNK